MKLSELLHKISYRLQGYGEGLSSLVADVVTDATDAGAHTLFVCTRTPLRDGHYHAVAAYSRGCRLFLAERGLALPEDATVILVEDCSAILAPIAAEVAGYPARQMTVLGVAGTDGKSSVAYLLHDILQSAGRSVAAMTSEGILRSKSFQTHGNILPDGAKTQHILGDLAREGVEILILEISPYMAEQHHFDGIGLTALALTNADLKPAYLAGLQRLAKRAAFAVLPIGGKHLLEGSRVLTFGAGGDLSAIECRTFKDKRGFGTQFQLLAEGEQEAVSLHIPGDFAIEDALIATALARIVGVEISAIAAALTKAHIRGTLECVCAAADRYIYRDAAYTPERLGRALAVLRKQTEGKLTVVIGSVGGRARERRAPLGRVAAEYADLVYLTADNPDNESPQSICEEMTSEIAEPWRYVILPDRAAAIRRAVLEMRPSDILLVAGKARENTQLIASEKQPFDETSIIIESARSF